MSHSHPLRVPSVVPPIPLRPAPCHPCHRARGQPPGHLPRGSWVAKPSRKVAAVAPGEVTGGDISAGWPPAELRALESHGQGWPRRASPRLDGHRLPSSSSPATCVLAAPVPGSPAGCGGRGWPLGTWVSPPRGCHRLWGTGGFPASCMDGLGRRKQPLVAAWGRFANRSREVTRDVRQRHRDMPGTDVPGAGGFG